VASRDYDIETELEKWLAGAKRVVVAGIGNPIRMDDFVGVKIVQELQGKVSEKVFLIECETVPESFIQQITEFGPTHVLLIDAAIMGLKPGESRLVETSSLISMPALSTHTLPLRIFCEYLGKTTNAQISLLLIQPRKTEFGEGLTQQLAASTMYVTQILRKLLPS
jgi:hydrogenase 3 maturation protease